MCYYKVFKRLALQARNIRQATYSEQCEKACSYITEIAWELFLHSSFPLSSDVSVMEGPYGMGEWGHTLTADQTLASIARFNQIIPKNKSMGKPFVWTTTHQIPKTSGSWVLGIVGLKIRQENGCNYSFIYLNMCISLRVRSQVKANIYFLILQHYPFRHVHLSKLYPWDLRNTNKVMLFQKGLIRKQRDLSDRHLSCCSVHCRDELVCSFVPQQSHSAIDVVNQAIPWAVHPHFSEVRGF